MPWHRDHAGTGPTLVLLHAFPLSSVMWHRLAPLVSPDVRLVEIDLPGLGRSDVPTEPPSMAAMAASVTSVLDLLDLPTATVMGLSTGGYVALELARSTPERLDALVLASTTCWVMAPDVPAVRRELAAELERAGTVEAVLGSAAAGLGATALREQPDLRPLLEQVVLTADPAGVAWAARAVADRSDTSAALAGLHRPVLLLFGDEDTDTPPERGVAMRALRTAPGATPTPGGESAPTGLVVLEDTGHLTALEQPFRVADLLLRWLRVQHLLTEEPA